MRGRKMKSQKNVYAVIGRRTRQERNRMGLTQEELAEKARIHPSFLGQIERGTKKASLVTIQRIADALGIAEEQLFNDNIHGSKEKKLSEYQQKVLSLMVHLPVNDQKFLYKTTKELYNNSKFHERS